MALILSSAVMFVLIMDPLGNVPLFLTAMRTVSPERRRWVIIRELLIALVIMVLFLFGGQLFMRAFAIDQAALTVAGGIILMLIALRMIFPTAEKNLSEVVLGEPFIVPMAVPYVAGPSLLAIEVVLTSKNPDGLPYYLAALVLAWFISAVVLYFSHGLNRLIGEKVMVAVERLMGMVLVIIATQMTLSGIQEFFLAP